MPIQRLLGHSLNTLVGHVDGRRGRSCSAWAKRGETSIKRRTVGLIVALVLGLLAAPLAGGAQQPKKVPRIGLLWAYSPMIVSPFAEAFRQGLRGLGYVEGENIGLVERWAEGRFDRLPALAAELLRANVDVIVAASTPAVQAAQQATRTIPIIMTLVSDPVESGLVGSLARPGGNVTGVSAMNPDLSGKRLQLLKELVPKVSRVAVLCNPSIPITPPLLRETEAAARALGVQLQVVEVRGPTEFDSAFSAMTRSRAGALVVLPDPTFRNEQRRILDFAAKSRLPAMWWAREFVDAGGLMAYGPNFPDIFRRAAVYVDKILKGAKPADLPVEQPMRFELVINMKTAKALGITFPQTILIRADQVIQ